MAVIDTALGDKQTLIAAAVFGKCRKRSSKTFLDCFMKLVGEAGSVFYAREGKGEGGSKFSFRCIFIFSQIFTEMINF